MVALPLLVSTCALVAYAAPAPTLGAATFAVDRIGDGTSVNAGNTSEFSGNCTVTAGP